MRFRNVVVPLAALTLAAAASVSLAGGAGIRGVAPAGDPVPAAVPPGLDRFYSQRLGWTPCEAGECATVEVPLDYTRPEGRTLRIAVFRAPARGRDVGAIVVNPGGPGASGIDYARQLSRSVSRSVARSLDLVGFDPRGVGASEGLHCLGTAATDAYAGLDPTPDDAAERAELEQGGSDFGRACVKADPGLVSHMSSTDVARDLDVIRASLAQRRLNYLGSSYGTLVGVDYLALFGANAGRIVLNGAIDPTLDGDQIALGQAEGFDAAAAAYARDCASRSDCPLGRDPDAGAVRLADIVSGFDARPVRTNNGPGVLNEAWGTFGVAQALYSTALWPRLTTALTDLSEFDEAHPEGNGDALMALAMDYAGRDAGGYANNSLQAINAVSCTDRGAVAPGMGHVADLARTAGEQSPLFGRYLGWARTSCATWPVAPTGSPGPATSPGVVNPVMVVGTTNDPATPYRWSVALAAQLPTGVLVTRRGDGHTGYLMGSRCTDRAVDTYLLTGEAPRADLTC